MSIVCVHISTAYPATHKNDNEMRRELLPSVHHPTLPFILTNQFLSQILFLEKHEPQKLLGIGFPDHQNVEVEKNPGSAKEQTPGGPRRPPQLMADAPGAREGSC